MEEGTVDQVGVACQQAPPFWEDEQGEKYHEGEWLKEQKEKGIQE